MTRKPMDVHLSSGERLYNEAGEDDVILEIHGVPYTKRQLAEKVAEARRRLEHPPPACDHEQVSPRDALCLGCGEIMRESSTQLEFRSVVCPCGQTMVKRRGHDCKCLGCGELVGS